MKIKYLISLLITSLLIVGCSKKEEKAIISLTEPSKKERDVELEEWEKVLEKQPYKVDVSKLKNPFIGPEILKEAIAKREKIPLELVGILEKNGEKLALLQDNTKKGYIVRKGSQIRNIKIIEIGPDYIIIEEEAFSIYGGIEKNRRILTLKKEKIL